MSLKHDEVLARFLERFHQDRLSLIKTHGPETFDQGQVLYRCAKTGKNVVVRDAFYGPSPEGPVEAFLSRLHAGWWKGRETFTGQAEEGVSLAAVSGLYAHYLAEVGFDYSVQLSPEGVVRAFRMDGRGRITVLTPPENEAMFRDQLGTFFDLRAGLRHLAALHRETKRLVVAEVQPGYVVGVRKGLPGDPDPARREEPEMEAVFSHYDPHTYDTLEFLAGPEAEKLPFFAERYTEWLGEDAEAVSAGQIEVFAMADSSEFVACIEDLCARRGVAVEWVEPDSDLRVALHLEPLRLEMAFAYPFLRTLHTGRSFAEGTRLFYLPAIDSLEDARDAFETARQALTGFEVTVEDGTVMVIRRPGEAEPVGRWNLMALVGRQSFRGAEGTKALITLLGYDADAGTFVPRPPRLDVCPLCGAPAHVGKVVRPLALLGVDPRTVLGIPIGEHLVYFTLDCPTHSTQVEPGPGVDLAAVETAYRAGLPEAVASLVELKALPEGAFLFVGFDVGSLVLEPGRVAALWEEADEELPASVFAYAFFPDALVVSPTALAGRRLHQARLAALEAVQPRYPGRTWALDLARPLSLTEPVGDAERMS